LRVDEGRAISNAARAARKLPPSGVASSPIIGLYGPSNIAVSKPPIIEADP
jgi:hypothetical protein